MKKRGVIALFLSLIFWSVAQAGVSFIDGFSTQGDISGFGNKDEDLVRAVGPAGNAERVRELLQAGANPNATDSSGNTALGMAIKNGNQNAVQLLLSAKADPNKADTHQQTPLMLAATAGQSAIIKTLLEYQANPYVKDGIGRTALDHAVVRGDPSSIEILKNPAGIINRSDGRGNSALMDLCGKTHGINNNYEAGLHIAEVKKLIELNADVNEKGPDGMTVLMKAVWADVKWVGSRIVIALLEAGANPRATMDGGMTALHWAVLSGIPHKAEVLLEKGADVNARLSDGSTPLMLAAEQGKVEAVQILLKAKAEVNAEDVVRQSAMRRAAKTNQTETMRLLREAHAYE